MIYQGVTPQVQSELEKLTPDPMRHIVWRLLAWIASIVAFGVHAFRFRRGKPSAVPAPDEPAIREYLSGNLCRCGSYQNILEAVKRLSGEGIKP